MKYIEELKHGDCFEFEDSIYVKSLDYKKNGDCNCISLKNGSSKWFRSNEIVSATNVYTLDKENNIIAIKPTEKNDV